MAENARVWIRSETCAWVPATVLSKATKEELYNGAPSYEEPPTWQLKKDDAPLNQRKVPLRARKDSAHAT